MDLSERLGAADATVLADQLELVVDGAFSTGRVFGPDGPHLQLVSTAAAPWWPQ